jgi:hypothetical protein
LPVLTKLRFVVTQLKTTFSILIFSTFICLAMSSNNQGTSDYYRADGVRIQHNPYTAEMELKYGKPGATDSEGFDPYRDSVGPGIYGGLVVRDKNGAPVIGEQYQGHNPVPGPVYAGGGYSRMSQALGDNKAVEKLLDEYPELVR